MPGVLSEIAPATLRLYVAAGSGALLVVFFVTAFIVPQTRAGAAVRAILVVLGAVVGGVLAWALADNSALGSRGGERRILQARAEELAARSLAPGSPLACLDTVAGDSVEAACERAIFSSPTNVAAATSYVAARVALLTELVAYVKSGGGDVDDVLLTVRNSLEADRFGFVAHLLATRDACTSQNCKAFALLRDASQVRTNLSDNTFDRYLARYQAAWGKPGELPVADIQPPSQPLPAARAAASGPRQTVNADFPSAASIPAVSIMNPEPAGPVLPGVAAAAAANPNPTSAQASSRRGRKQAATPPPQPATAPAAPAAPPARAAAVEPIWPEPVPPQPQPQPQPQQQQPAPPAAAAPVPFNPFGPGPIANASMTVPAQ